MDIEVGVQGHITPKTTLNAAVKATGCAEYGLEYSVASGQVEAVDRAYFQQDALVPTVGR